MEYLHFTHTVFIFENQKNQIQHRIEEVNCKVDERVADQFRLIFLSMLKYRIKACNWNWCRIFVSIVFGTECSQYQTKEATFREIVIKCNCFL